MSNERKPWLSLIVCEQTLKNEKISLNSEILIKTSDLLASG